MPYPLGHGAFLEKQRAPKQRNKRSIMFWNDSYPNQKITILINCYSCCLDRWRSVCLAAFWIKKASSRLKTTLIHKVLFTYNDFVNVSVQQTQTKTCSKAAVTRAIFLLAMVMRFFQFHGMSLIQTSFIRDHSHKFHLVSSLFVSLSVATCYVLTNPPWVASDLEQKVTPYSSPG